MKTTYAYDRYYRYDELTAVLQGYARDYPDLARLTSLAATPGGREVWLLELTDTAAGDFEEKPGYYLNGHVHAGEVTGSMCVLYFLDYMLTNREDPEVRGLLKNVTFYAVPRSVPDGAEYYLTTPGTVRSFCRPWPPVGEASGVVPRDLDGDGVIRKMLVPSPYGVWKKAQDDPRVLVKRRPDEAEGTFYNVYDEGVPEGWEGGDLQPAPPVYGLDLNRNFPMGWVTNDKLPSSGVYPLDQPESRALAAFSAAHPNICSAIVYHTYSGIYLYPPGIKSRAEADPEDMARYDAVNDIVRETTGFTPLCLKDDFTGDSTDSGCTDDFLHFGLGVFNYSVECWDLWARCGIDLPFPNFGAASDREGEEWCRKLYRWADQNGLGEYILDWTPFDHPQLGRVELGGVDPKRLLQNPPPRFLPEEVEKHTRFILRHARTLPRLVIRQVKTTPLGGGLYRVEAFVCNAGYMPTQGLNEFLKSGLCRDVTVELSGGDLRFADGAPVREIGQLEGFSGVNSRYSFFGVDTAPHNPAEKKVSWIVAADGPATLTVTARSQRAGTVRQQISLP